MMRSTTIDPSDHKAFYRTVFTIAIPVALQSLLTQLVEASDSLMLSVLSQDALSAISLATQVHFVLNILFVFLNVVTSSMSAQYRGKEDILSVEKTLAFAEKLSLSIGFVFFLAAFSMPGVLMKVFTNETVLIELGRQYLRIVSFSYLFMGLSSSYLSVMKNTDRVAKSSAFSSTAVVLNLIGNALLIYGLLGLPAMEIRGAALATVIARGVEAGLCLLESHRTKIGKLRLSLLLTDDKPIRIRFLSLLKGSLGNGIVWGFGTAMFSVIIGHLGSDAVAANSLANIVRRLILCLSMGVGNSAQIIIGRELGADHFDTAKVYVKRLFHTGLSIAAVSGAILFALTPTISSLAGTLSETARMYLRYMLYFNSFYVVGKTANSVFIHGCFYAGGDMRFGFICDLINLWCFILPVGALLAFVFRVPVLAVYCFLNLDEIVKIPAEYIHYRKFKWLRNFTVVE